MHVAYGRTHHRRVLGNVAHDDGVRADARTAVHDDGSEQLGASADLYTSSDDRAAVVSRDQSDTRPRSDDDAAVDLGETVDDSLAMGDVHAGTYDDRITDAHLGDHDRESVKDARHHGDTQSLQARLRSVAGLREERIAHDHESGDLHRGVDATTKFESLTSARERDPRVGM